MLHLPLAASVGLIYVQSNPFAWIAMASRKHLAPAIYCNTTCYLCCLLLGSACAGATIAVAQCRVLSIYKWGIIVSLSFSKVPALKEKTSVLRSLEETNYFVHSKQILQVLCKSLAKRISKKVKRGICLE